jgi:hypothetical protein
MGNSDTKTTLCMQASMWTCHLVSYPISQWWHNMTMACGASSNPIRWTLNHDGRNRPFLTKTHISNDTWLPIMRSCSFGCTRSLRTYGSRSPISMRPEKIQNQRQCRARCDGMNVTVPFSFPLIGGLHLPFYATNHSWYFVLRVH